MKDDNELIAEFMGLVFVKEIDGIKYYDVPKGTFNMHNASMGYFLYHKCWDWLMPVVEKIESLMPHIKIPDDLEALKNGTHGSEMYVDVISLPIASKITEVHEAIVKFIVWYNQQPKP